MSLMCFDYLSRNEIFVHTQQPFAKRGFSFTKLRPYMEASKRSILIAPKSLISLLEIRTLFHPLIGCHGQGNNIP